MFALLHSLAMFFVDLFKPRRRLETENLFLRHQLSIALRRAPPRLRLRGSDRALLVWMTRLWPTLFNTTRVVQPGTILRWYRAGAWSLDIRLSTTSRGAAIPDICAFMSTELVRHWAVRAGINETKALASRLRE